MSFWGVVVAAGAGRRFGGSKHHAELAGKPLWQWSRDALTAAGAAEVVVVGAVPGGVAGGARRRDSVAAGLAQVPPDVGHVLVHDAARPLATPILVRAVADRLAAGDADGVVPVLAVRDTLKRVDGGWVAETVARAPLAAVQTPQGFVSAVLRRAHAAGDADATDDAALVEAIGGRVATVPGEATNLKITYPEDLLVAAALLAAR